MAKNATAQEGKPKTSAPAQESAGKSDAELIEAAKKFLTDAAAYYIDCIPDSELLDLAKREGL